MESSKILNEIPFLRIILPFIAGIIIYLNLSSALNCIYYVLLFFCLTFLLWRKMKKNNSEFLKNSFGGCSQLFLIFFGYQFAFQHEHFNDKNNYSNYPMLPQEFIAVVGDIPVKGEKVIKAELQIQKIRTNDKWEKSGGKLLAYIHEKKLQKINYGDQLQFKSHLQLPETPKNPGGFNYSSFLKRKQIFHTCLDRKSTRLNSSHIPLSRMPSSA